MCPTCNAIWSLKGLWNGILFVGHVVGVKGLCLGIWDCCSESTGFLRSLASQLAFESASVCSRR